MSTVRVVLIEHEVNQGVGSAIATGYKWARDQKIDITVVMAGDAQMDPRDLPVLLDPVAKGDRLVSGEAGFELVLKPVGVAGHEEFPLDWTRVHESASVRRA